MFCLKCGNQIPDGAAFCPRCGTKSEVVAPEQTTQVVKETFCPKCGNKMAEGERFCSKCGTNVQATSTPQQPQSQFFGAFGNGGNTQNNFNQNPGSAPNFAQNQNPNTNFNPNQQNFNGNQTFKANPQTPAQTNSNLPPFLQYFMAPIKCLPSFILGLMAAIFGIFGGLCMTMCASIYGRGEEAFIFIFGGSIIGLIGACLCLSKARIGAIAQAIGTCMILYAAYGVTGGDFMTIISFILFIVSTIINVVFAFVLKRK